MQVQSTLDTFQTTLIMEMQPKSTQKNYQNLTSWLEDFLVNLSVLVETEKDLTIQEELSFLKSQGFSKTKNPNIFYSKMYETYYLMKGGGTIKKIFEVLSDLDYYVETEIYNSKDYGTPQRRERIFIKGYYTKGTSFRKILPFRKNSRKIMELKPMQLNNHKKTYQDGRIYGGDGASICLNARGNNGWYQLSDNEHMPCTKEGDAFALTTKNRQRPFKKHLDNYVVYSKKKIRKLTPLECERLQGFPDGWTEFGKDGELISDTQRYKCIGNAVTTNVITAIVDEMFMGVIGK